MENLARRTVLWAAAGSIVYLMLFFFVDRPTVLWIHNNCADTWLPLVGTYISYLAKGSFVRLGLAVCFLLILVVDSGIERRETKLLLYICICGAIGMTVGDGLKYFLGRYRPILLFDKDLYGLDFFSTQWAMNSTPSGHTLRAFAIMTALSLLFGRFRIVFISVAVVIGLSRIAVTDHYPSDVLFGAFIGTFTALWTYVYYFRQNVREGKASHFQEGGDPGFDNERSIGRRKQI